MKAVGTLVTTLIILVASIVLGVGVVLYGKQVFHQSDNSTSINEQIVKPVVTYYKEGVDPYIKIGNNTEKSIIVAVDTDHWKILLSNGQKIDLSLGPSITYYKNNTIVQNDYGLMVNELTGAKVIIHSTQYKPTCDYVFDWGDNFNSYYHVDGFNFTQIPNSTNFDFVQSKQYLFGKSCDINENNIDKIEVFVK